VPKSTQNLIVVVEDDERNRRLTCDLLAAWGYRVVAFTNGRDGVEGVRRERPDLVLMDLRMPVMDGYEATKTLKADPETADIPVAIMTASAMTGSEPRIRQCGCDEYKTKPFDIREIRKMIAKYVPLDDD